VQTFAEILSMSPSSLRLVLVEQGDAYAGRLRRLFGDYEAVVLEHAPTAERAQQISREPGCEVLLVDFGASADRAAARALCAAIKESDTAPPVVALIDEWDERLVLEALQAGAREYLLKTDSDPRSVLRTIRYAVERDRADRALREREAQLRQSQKLEAIGRLAGGIAHDFNNLLTVIVGSTDRLLERLTPGTPLWDDAEAVRSTAARAVALTQQILAFSRQQPSRPAVLDINELLAGMERFVRPLLGEDIDLTFRFGPDIRMVRADPSQLEQVFLNLLVNARDATPAGGRLSIETRNVSIQSANEVPALAPGPYVLASVIDTGRGMDEATRARAFEPFFTTKDAGTGTGLGLSIAYGIVARAGGAMKIVSEPGAGTAMLVYLPVAAQPAVAAPAAAPAAEAKPAIATAAPAGGHETILLVEDEDAVRELVEEMLTSAGFTVLSACRPTGAEELCRSFTGNIHLLLSDVVMPDMSGRELAERVQVMRPGVKVLLMSGYPEHSALPGSTPSGELPLLGKPFNRRTLLDRVRGVLDTAVV
jgi:signal transduction histidine kinase